jgi:predicted Zn-dependent protease
MNKRLAMLESMTRAGGADAFAWYGLAMEYRREQRTDDALSTFDQLKQLHPDYLPMYLMAGQVLLQAGRPQEARGWLEAGVSVGEAQGNDKAVGELRDALNECS